MIKLFIKGIGFSLGLTIVFLILASVPSLAAIDGVPVVSGVAVNFTARDGVISTPDGGSIHIWGFALNGGTVQYPGPTLIANQGDTVVVTLTNQLSVPVSIVFPGQAGVTASGADAVPGLLTMEAPPGKTVTYSFIATNPGTYLYHSGTRPDLQVEMGLIGALIVRPTLGVSYAYNHADSFFDHEYLFLLSEIIPDIHELVAAGKMDKVDNTKSRPVYWFINGRAAPDTMAPNRAPWLPTQPYNCMPTMHPGEKILMRLIGAGRDSHPFHYHGNHARVIAREARLLESALGNGADLSELFFTITVSSGKTVDAIYTWTGEGLGWDLYGHAPGDPMQPNEYAPDHGKAFPVILPDNKDLAFGPFWSGSPFLGVAGSLPPGQGGFNPTAGYFFMWHSHAEIEMTNNNIFPGGLMTMLIIEHPDVPIMNP
jgi:FtsP/CotA-like multicopper oxidase with cupredoxin domain